MCDDILEYLLKGVNAINAGPNAREILCAEIENDYNNGNVQNSIFYQVMMLFQTFEERTGRNAAQADEADETPEELLASMNSWEQEDFKSNVLMQHVFKQLQTATASYKDELQQQLKSSNFLQDVRCPEEGLRRIEYVCQQMPKEWTIIQLSKGPCVETTYNIYPKIHESCAPTYLTLLRHARSHEIAQPVCLRFALPEHSEYFKKLSTIADLFKQRISVNPAHVVSTEDKLKYWKNLQELENSLMTALEGFRNHFYPWLWLFTGSPVDGDAATAQYLSEAFASIDRFCAKHRWEDNERVLLSLCAMHCVAMSEQQLRDICRKLCYDTKELEAAVTLLLELQAVAAKNAKRASNPCILIVDERLDHLYWEEMNVQQEFCRVSSLQCLWNLHQRYKQRIRNGYLLMNVETGGCVLNPDGNLSRMEMRMKSFFEYWVPHWLLKCAQKPTMDDFSEEFFQRNCFVYAGHGSGLQYISGKHLARQQMQGVVFLFGCDSSRLRSNGLYSELVGAHLFYKAADCPAFVGTVLPGLDAYMDTVAAAILSQWIGPKSRSVLPWNQIDARSWSKTGIIQAKPSKSTASPATMAETSDYQLGSLPAIIARVHQRLIDPKHYNTVGYVYRGLPVWNSSVQPMRDT